MSRYNLEPLMKDVHNNEIEMYKKFQEDQTDSHGEKAKVAFWGVDLRGDPYPEERSQCTESVQALKSCIISVKDTGLGLGLGLQGVVKQKLSYWLRRYGRSNCLYRITEERSQCTESVQALKSCIISVKDTGLGLGLGLQGAAQNKQGRGAY
ncbi:uncharacterized protein PSFLO_02839 [Pseudozyma flocculosa]|uniref:Uncharacterized protein n=1 Tax=Pseudozyma flocculosa TaxID=84751 RepID=A0A5C3F0D6_9BASI|nr:uncharacterized protein PSFLO_02839 [Pseudozyma flocculosa]